MKRAFIVHSWGASPDDCWYPWLAKALEDKVMPVERIKMPRTDKPDIDSWVSCLAKAVGKPDRELFLIGHSIGCQTIMRYLESIEGEIGGVLFVAPWFSLNGLGAGEKKIAQPWIATPIDFDAVKERGGKIVSLFSTDDPYVPVGDAKLFKRRLGTKVMMLGAHGHFDDDTGVDELPEALDLMMKMVNL